MRLDSKAIGRQIRRRRKAENQSQELLAELADTSTRTISNIETGAVLPSLKTLANLAESFCCSIDELIRKE